MPLGCWNEEMRKMVQTVIFDMDGTLLNTLEDMLDSVNVTMDYVMYPRRTRDEVRAFVGNGAAKLIERCMPKGKEDERFDEALEFYRKYYNDHAQIKTEPYPGIPLLLQQLQKRGIFLAVVSNKPDEAVQQLTRRYFPNVFSAIVGNRADCAVKPAPDTVFLALSKMNQSADKAVYVGDSEVDIATGKNAGMPCFSVTWGFRTEEFLSDHGAERLIHSTEELQNALLDWNPMSQD